MKIKSISIYNFKTFDSTGISLTLKDLTALVGENSSGKSNVLEALDLFFNYSKSSISKRSFHYNDVSKDIKIEIVFYKLNPEEQKKFNVHLDEAKEELSITQKIFLKLDEGQDINQIDESDYEFEESKHGTKWQPLDKYEWANLEKPTKTNIRKWWKSDLMIDNLDFKSLFDKRESEPSPDEYFTKLEILWDKYFEKIPKQRITGDEKVLGWKNKLKGNLPKLFFIPAVKYVQEDLKVLKTNPFGEMISWLTGNISDAIRRDFEEKTKPIIKEAIAQIDKDELGESKIAFLNKRLNENLGMELGCKLELKFGSPSISEIVFPSPQLRADDGYDSEITQKGHGIQRLSMFSLLRTYNDFIRRSSDGYRNIIIAIEEPEIYLHPPIKRATYNLLRDLSMGRDQIIYSTHDECFVSVEYFDEIRLFRKKRINKPITEIYEFSIENLIRLYKECYGIDVDEKSLRHRFSHICDESKNEGFFSAKVVLIEGATEKYALPLFFRHGGLDIDSERTSIISAGSVDNISYLYVMFNEFHIPCYMIFDGDKPDGEIELLEAKQKEEARNKSKKNKELLALLGEDVGGEQYFFPDTSVHRTYAVWEKDYESVFHRSLAEYERIKGDAKRLYGTDSKPLTGRYFAETIIGEMPENIDPLIGELIQAIKGCSWSRSCIPK